MENLTGTTYNGFPTEDLNDENATTTATNPFLWNSTQPPSQNISNSTNEPWEAEDVLEVFTAGLWIYTALRILWGCMAIFSNGLTIRAVTKFEQLQTWTNYLICSLAASDIMAGLMVPLEMAHELYPRFSQTQFFIPICLSSKIMSLMTTAGNMLNILYLSIDRYIYIAFPLRYHDLVTTRRMMIILSVTWSCILLLTPTIVIFGNHLEDGMPCRLSIFLDGWVKSFYLFPQTIIIASSTVGFHIAIAKIARDQARKIEQQPMATLDVAISQSTKKISHTLGMMLGGYLILWIPQSVVFYITKRNRSTWERYTLVIYWANTWINPLIYTWRLKDFRIAFKKIFTGKGSFNEVP